MKKQFFLFGLALFALSAHAVEVDGLAATIGTQSILKSDVINELKRTGWGIERAVEVRNILIERCLILKAAENAKMTMQDWVIENRIREIIDKSFGGDRNRLIDMLAQQKISYPEWSKRVKEDLIVGAMRWNVIDKNVKPSPAEMRAEFAAHPERYREKEKVSVSILTIKPGEEKPKTFDESKVKKYEKVSLTDSFHAKIQDEIRTLKKGEKSKWIELDGWNFMIRKDDETAANARTFAEAYDDIEENVRRETSVKLYREWMDRLKAETFIKIY